VRSDLIFRCAAPGVFGSNNSKSKIKLRLPSAPDFIKSIKRVHNRFLYMIASSAAGAGKQFRKPLQAVLRRPRRRIVADVKRARRIPPQIRFQSETLRQRARAGFRRISTAECALPGWRDAPESWS